ncbi:MAG: hypothetical protein JSU90_03020 [Nitrospiraceae bacterium]|nr:MAG: hypothetical protein JSU90_03020 [Nitrospiraceae bacterium]
MKDLWVFLFFLGAVLFGWPIISMFGHHVAFYLFSAWITLIIFVFLAARADKRREPGG